MSDIAHDTVNVLVHRQRVIRYFGIRGDDGERPCRFGGCGDAAP